VQHPQPVYRSPPGFDFPDTVKDYSQADQFQQTTQCGGPFGPNGTYCSTILK
jgi:hypothetical protein